MHKEKMVKKSNLTFLYNQIRLISQKKVNKTFWSVGAQDHRPVAFDFAVIVTGEDSETSFSEF